ncbi:porin [Paraburkholderia sediminicola]|uniref:porin n=1 Tax=Paraburkholderia sediminicola TaxID=458836 RepID=UPI0038BB4AAA
MKKLKYAAIPLLLASTGALAQSSVTLYGLIDEGVDYTNNVGGRSNWEMQSGYAQGSRWGLKGAEDLGGGLQAIFQLESGFDVNTGALGQAQRAFGRQAFVGLQSATLGTVTFGRQYDSMVDYVGPLTANGNWGGYLFSHPLDNDNTDDSFRLNNAVKYTSNTYGGFQFGGLYGFSNQAGGFANNRTYSLGAQYTGGAVSVAASYMLINNPGANNSGALATDDTTFVATRQRVWGGGINYTVAAATFGFVYTHTDLNNPAGSSYIGNFATVPDTLKFDNFELNAKYQFTPAFYAGAMYTFTEAKFNTGAGTAKPKWNQFGLMADYNLSKRTDVYVQGVYQKLSGGTTGTTLDTAFIPGADAPSSNASQLVARVAIRHQF